VKDHLHTVKLQALYQIRRLYVYFWMQNYTQLLDKTLAAYKLIYSRINNLMVSIIFYIALKLSGSINLDWISLIFLILIDLLVRKIFTNNDTE